MMRYAFLILFIFTFCVSLFSCSEDETGRRQRRSPEEQAKLLQEELDLSDEQTNQVEKIYADSRQEIVKARENFDGDRRHMREIMMEYRKKTNQQIVEVLNEDQEKNFQEYLDEQQERMRKRREDRSDRDR